MSRPSQKLGDTSPVAQPTQQYSNGSGLAQQALQSGEAWELASKARLPSLVILPVLTACLAPTATAAPPHLPGEKWKAKTRKAGL